MHDQRNPRSRAIYWFAATIIIAAALAAAVWLHGYRVEGGYASKRAEIRAEFGLGPRAHQHPSWADPAAIAIAIVGVGTGAALVWKAAPR